jgi:RNA polymerase sigma-70 factor (family 1)
MLAVLSSIQAEKDILVEMITGNEIAFEKIYQLYSARLITKLVKLVKSESQAQEILQDVFLKLWEHRNSIDPEKSFRSYLFKIAENKVYDFFRKAAREKEIELQLIAYASEDYTATDDYPGDGEHLATLQKAIELLSPQRQQVIRLCKLDGKSYKEVSELLGIRVSTISDHIVKGTKSIRDHFDRNR